MSIQVGGELFSHNNILKLPNQNGTLATQEYVQANVGGGSSYLSYTALLSQTGTDDPTAVVLQNTLGGDIVWTRGGVGGYIGTLTNAFTENKTWCSPSGNDHALIAFTGGGWQGGFNFYRGTVNEIFIDSFDAAGGFLELSSGIGAASIPLEIRVYP